MIKRLLISFATIAVAAASAATYKVDLSEPLMVAGKQLPAGEYKIAVDGGKAVFHNGKQETEAPVKVETAGNKFKETTFRFDSAADGTRKLEEINVGGSHTSLEFGD